MKESLTYYCDDSRHLVCTPYSIANLHQMAEDLKIKRSWYHGGMRPHYDIPKKRIPEIQSKCTVISSREILLITQGKKV